MQPFPSITALELQALISKGCHLVDVREPVEHAEEHIAGAKLIPLGEIEQRLSEIEPDTPLVVMCRSGKRGALAMERLKTLGIDHAQNLEGGMLAWKAAGLPVSSAEKKVFPLMQQVQVVIGLGVVLGVVLSRTLAPAWVYLSAFFGAGLLFAGLTGWCGLAMLMSKMPWNRVAAHCSISE
jgi:rhodanese-related sulfurtransferase